MEAREQLLGQEAVGVAHAVLTQTLWCDSNSNEGEQ